MVGVIYFVRTGQEDAVKVGLSHEGILKSRISGLQVGNPYPLHLVGTLEGDHENEAGLHEYFRPHLIRGEWYFWTRTREDIRQFLSGKRPLPRRRKRPGGRPRGKYDMDRAVRMLLSGESMSEVVRSVGASRMSLREHLTRLPPDQQAEIQKSLSLQQGYQPQRGPENFDQEKLEALLDRGATIQEAADRFGAGKKTLYRWMQLWGVPTPQQRRLGGMT